MTHANRGVDRICRGTAWTLALLLSACATTPPAPVEDIALDERQPPRETAPRAVRQGSQVATHKVVAGDTLYSIAFKNGLDFREIARFNHIEAPYRIYVGQQLKLGEEAPPAGVAVAAVPSAPAPTRISELPPEPPRRPAPGASATTAPTSIPASGPNSKVDPLAVRSATPPSNERPPGTLPASKPPANSVAAATQPIPAIAPVPTPPAPAATTPAADPVALPAKSGALAPGANTTAVATPGPTTPVLNSGGVSWRWPASGKVVGTFIAGDQTRQGVDIAGSAGAAVAAAADGSVVYSGNGLLGYGELIIVKHSASFLSAYGHNRKRLVKEGDTVKAGQAIAEMGGSNREMLHFEIRRNGKPVNPLEYLPAR
ncbi:murein DD-endopeptidase MepM/ murein hydrolase activator NlpD [Tahibacter aquaticus]|uniref:Murein DD-endopeptidase MepM/ murein hydrolase activator NlpD n=1 Tax=Tahibacter aquaticus TaxID=520092 RepID=A0A4V3DLG2_9GAMM|nr:peptidoglycan DD-metalloendopeptidase family protein [Tahibacter aquaticus]TDR39434.1 murein DD-endopeptidase MepM/ murein hydrolase activator NlpD [Tahibacter aquaticus]